MVIMNMLKIIIGVGKNLITNTLLPLKNINNLNKLTKEELIDLVSNLFNLLNEAQNINNDLIRILENIKNK